MKKILRTLFGWKDNPENVFYVAMPLGLMALLSMFLFAYLKGAQEGDWIYMAIVVFAVALGGFVIHAMVKQLKVIVPGVEEDRNTISFHEIMCSYCQYGPVYFKDEFDEATCQSCFEKHEKAVKRLREHESTLVSEGHYGFPDMPKEPEMTRIRPGSIVKQQGKTFVVESEDNF